LENAEIKDFRFHDLRHTFATYTLLVTKNLRLVQDLMGHKSVTMTQKYAHILQSQKSDALNLLGGMIDSARIGDDAVSAE
jgi:site-specific recombinase XerD